MVRPARAAADSGFPVRPRPPAPDVSGSGDPHSPILRLRRRVPPRGPALDSAAGGGERVLRREGAGRVRGLPPLRHLRGVAARAGTGRAAQARPPALLLARPPAAPVSLAA